MQRKLLKRVLCERLPLSDQDNANLVKYVAKGGNQNVFVSSFTQQNVASCDGIAHVTFVLE